MTDPTSTRRREAHRVLVALDPGRNIGVAYVSEGGELLSSAVIALSDLAGLDLPAEPVVLVGAGTGRRDVLAALRARGFAPVLVDERSTTLAARELYFRDNPPRGLGKLLPRGMRHPPRDIDDYAAYAIALRWLDERDDERRHEESG